MYVLLFAIVLCQGIQNDILSKIANIKTEDSNFKLKLKGKSKVIPREKIGKANYIYKDNNVLEDNPDAKKDDYQADIISAKVKRKEEG